MKRGSQSFTKPRGLQEEKSRTDAEIVALKHNLNICREENTRLKEQMHRGQKEMEVKDVYIKELILKANAPNSSPKHNSSPSGPHLIIGLRQQIRELNSELNRVRKEKDELIKSNKATKLNETQAQLRASLEECKRLRGMFNAAISGKGTEVEDIPESEQKMVIKKLTLENQELLKEMKKKDIELAKLREISKRSQSKKRIQLKPNKVVLGPARGKVEDKSTYSPKTVENTTLKIDNSHLENEIKIIKEHLTKCNATLYTKLT